MNRKCERLKTVKLLGEENSLNFHDPKIDKHFFKTGHKILKQKILINWTSLTLRTTTHTVKCTIQRVKRQITVWENIFVIHKSSKEL